MSLHSTSITRSCACCGKDFSFPHYRLNRNQRYCSLSCAGKCKKDLPPVKRGAEHPQWKGDDAHEDRKRVRAHKVIPNLTECEECGKPATDRHHKDGNTGNNDLSNLAQLCRRCHMIADGRIDRLVKVAAANSQANRTEPTPCRICGRMWKAMRKGRCARCAMHWYIYGTERPNDDPPPKQTATKMILSLSERDMAALEELAREEGSTKTAIMRQALYLYQEHKRGR